jgi:hypothetical protein
MNRNNPHHLHPYIDVFHPMTLFFPRFPLLILRIPMKHFHRLSYIFDIYTPLSICLGSITIAVSVNIYSGYLRLSLLYSYSLSCLYMHVCIYHIPYTCLSAISIPHYHPYSSSTVSSFGFHFALFIPRYQYMFFWR